MTPVCSSPHFYDCLLHCLVFMPNFSKFIDIMMFTPRYFNIYFSKDILISSELKGQAPCEAHTTALETVSTGVQAHAPGRASWGPGDGVSSLPLWQKA